MQAWLRARSWSPYAAGAGLGVVSTLALLFSNQLLGASGTFETAASGLLKTVGAGLSQSVYFRFLMPPGFTWQVWLLVGVFLGALASSLLSGDFAWEWTPREQWTQVFGPSRWKRWGIAFAGGVLCEYGAGIAGGCTSGLAISGGVQLAPAAFLFVGGLFTTGIVTAHLAYGRKKALVAGRAGQRTTGRTATPRTARPQEGRS
ncbi:YeeE/YedE family protein [Limnochorda pilosa]|uniref:YeeE/YedE family protein n=1 Tax=Limnochorda pilosa TaxID=1555112 RepID=A0A0K2SJE3_LIMPI|nr:YeeE/YedE family protein [Limnochorda pilosa]